MALTKIDDRGLTTPIDLLDDEKIRFGTTDNDLEIFHGSNISTIKDGKGDLRIMSDTIRIQRNAGGENYIYATEGGAVKLHYDGGTAKLETTSTGAKVTGALQTTGNVDVNGGSINLGVIDTSSGHINAAEVMTFNIDTDNDDTTRYFAFYNNGAGGSGTELFRIQEDGNVGIGTQSPLTDAQLTISEASDPALAFQRSGSGKYDAGILVSSGHFHFKGGADSTTVAGLNELVKIESTGNVNITDGNLVVASGHGIDFSATGGPSNGTGTSELLADYEEGTFSPVLRAHNSSTGQVTGTGTYIRVGKIVHLRISFNDKDCSNIPNSAVIKVDDLPFVCDNMGQDGNHTTSVVMTHNVVIKPDQTFYSVDNTDYLLGIYNNSGTGWSNWASDDFNQGAVYVEFCMSMTVD